MNYGKEPTSQTNSFVDAEIWYQPLCDLVKIKAGNPPCQLSMTKLVVHQNPNLGLVLRIVIQHKNIKEQKRTRDL